MAASREIVLSVRSLDLGVQREQPLDVGVGIATGKAFVGNIQSIDRLIWSAIGDTSNLAARLQSLTRELDAAIVIDSATWTAARDVVARFRAAREDANSGTSSNRGHLCAATRLRPGTNSATGVANLAIGLRSGEVGLRH